MARGDVKITITGDKSKLSSTLNDADGDLGSFTGKAAGWGSKLAVVAAGLAVAFGAAFLGVGAGLFALGGSFDKAYDNIRITTGATGTELAGLESDFKAVVQNVPDDFGTASTAIAGLSQRLGLTGTPLQDLSTQVLNLSRLTGTDLATNVDQVTRLFGDWGVATGDQSGTLDKLFRAAQASGAPIGDLQAQLVQFGAPLRNLGFGLDESTALLAQFSKTGVNTDTVIAGLKAGVGKLAKAGEDVPSTFKRVVEEITALGPGSEATGKAIELFGQRAGPDLADAIAGGKFELGDMLAAITGGTDTIAKATGDTEDFGEKFAKLKNRVFVGLEPLASGVFNAIGDGLDRLGPITDEAIGGVMAFVGAFRDGGNDVTSSGFAGKLEQFGLIARRVFDTLKSAVMTVLPIVRDVLVAGITRVWGVLTDLFGLVSRNQTVFKVLGAALLGAAAGFGALLIVAKLSQAVRAASAAFAVLNAVLAANPIILIALAIGALIGILVALYFKFEAVRNVVDAVGRFLRDTFMIVVQNLAFAWSQWFLPALQAVAGFLADHVWPVLQTVGKFIGEVFVAYVKVLAGIWTGVLWPALQAVAGFIAGTVVPIVLKIAQVFGQVASWVIVNTGVIVSTVLSIGGRIAGFVGRMWNGITSGISAAASAVSWVVGGIVNVITGIGDRIGSVAEAISSPFRSAFGAIKSLWNNTVGGFSFTVPDWIPGVGGKGFTIPNMHIGGVVPGMTGGEQMTLLEAGETVRTREQEARLQRIIGGLSSGAQNVQPAVLVAPQFLGPVAGPDGERWVMDTIEKAVARGLRAPRLKAQVQQ